MNAPVDPRRPGYIPTRIMPQSYQDVEDCARKFIKAGVFRGNPEDAPEDVKEAQCVVAIMTGMDAGMTPAQAVGAIYIKDGRCNITGQGCLALIRGAGCRVDQTEAAEANGWKASCTITRMNGEIISREYTREDAIRAGLWRNEVDLSSTWWTAQAQMLLWRSVGRAATFGCSDILRGLHILEVTNSEMDARADRKASPTQAPLPEVPDDIDQDRAFIAGIVNDEWDSKRYLAGLKAAMENVKTAFDLNAIWDSHLHDSDGKLSSAEEQEAMALEAAACARLG